MQLENKAEIKTLLPVMKKDFAFVKAFMAREDTHKCQTDKFKVFLACKDICC